MIIIFVMAILPSFCSRKDQNNAGKAVIKNEGNVTIITNPEDPKYGEAHLDLIEDLSIGNDDDTNYQFFRITGILLDEEENIYALDSGNCRVQKFDKNGRYLRTIGRKGQGPGEFVNPSAFFLDGEGNLYISDQMKIEVFAATGEYKKSISLETRIYEFIVTQEGQIITHTELSADEGNKKAIIKLNPEGKIIERMVEFTDVKAVQSDTREGNIMTFKAYHQYNYWPYLYPSDNDGFVYAYPFEYRLFNVNADGKICLVIEKDTPPNPISSEEKNFIKNSIRKLTEKRGIQISDGVLEAACQFPPHRPFFNRILLDDAGRIYVSTAGSVLDPNVEIRMDIFNKNGIYLYRASLSFKPDLIHNGNIYDVFTSDQTGSVEIKRYRIANWDRLEN